MGGVKSGGIWDVFMTALKLGLTSFGGPVAHVGYFRQEYVMRKKWLDDRTFADLTALCQFLPGPASSQLGMAIGMRRAGIVGALAGWLGFTLPSALLMALFAIWLGAAGADVGDAGWLHGLKLVAVAVVAQAVWSMGRTLAPDRPRAALAFAAACWAVLVPGPAGQLVPLVLCALAGLALLKPVVAEEEKPSPDERQPLKRRTALALFAVFLALLALLPAAARQYPDSTALALADSHYRAGSLVFGGGHVVLPMLEGEIVDRGVSGITADTMMAGYGAVQAMPGPLFSIAAFIGGVSAPGWNGALLAALALTAIFIPSFLLLAGAMPFWNALRGDRRVRGALNGVNAGVVGLLLAALYDPVWTGTVRTATDFAFVLGVFAFLHFWKQPPWLAVALSALIGRLLWP
nr:chromate efflux transporter [uncultured Paenibacillus sp.]